MSFLPGMFPGGAAAAAVALTTLAQQASATSTASTITCPTVAAGDLIILYDSATNESTTPTEVYPSGFASIVTDIITGQMRCSFSYKIADGTESGASLTGMSGNVEVVKSIYTFRGNTSISSLTISTPTHQASSSPTDPSSQLIAAAGDTVPLVAIAGWTTIFGTVDPRSFTPAKDGELHSAGTNIDTYIAYKLYNDGSTPADITIDMADEGVYSFLFGFFIECA